MYTRVSPVLYCTVLCRYMGLKYTVSSCLGHFLREMRGDCICLKATAVRSDVLAFRRMVASYLGSYSTVLYNGKSSMGMYNPVHIAK